MKNNMSGIFKGMPQNGIEVEFLLQEEPSTQKSMVPVSKRRTCTPIHADEEQLCEWENEQEQFIEVLSCIQEEHGRFRVAFDNHVTCLLYRGERKHYHIEEGHKLTAEQYHQLLTDTLGKRAQKRAMHLLEQMDRTEKQLRDKLAAGEYPQECVEQAISYVKQFHYLDDERYACNFVRFSQQKCSRQQLKQKLMQKGVARDIAEWALELEYVSDEQQQIRALLARKHFAYDCADRRETQRMYQFLLRRGFRSSDILKAINCENNDNLNFE
jgi:regulatory protein